MTPVKTVERAIDMLECFSAERPDLSVGQLASLLSVDKSVASRMAATLRSRRIAVPLFAKFVKNVLRPL